MARLSADSKIETVAIFNENCVRAGEAYPINPQKEDLESLEANGDITVYQGTVEELEAEALADLKYLGALDYNSQVAFRMRVARSILEQIGRLPDGDDGDEEDE